VLWNFETAWFLGTEFQFPVWQCWIHPKTTFENTRATMSVLPRIEGGSRVHWLLLGSLALNLFFVGAAGAVAYRYSSPVPLTTVSRIEHNLVERLNRVADSLPPTDAGVMRAQLRSDEVKIAAAQADVRLSQDDVRKSLRAEPFDADAMRKAMAANHDAHERFDQVIHDMLASAASKMSVVGRNKLADWPAQRANVRPVQ
jgi:uncharacterized membrane protein